MKVGSVKCVFPEDVCGLWWVYRDILSYVKQHLCLSQTLVQDLKKKSIKNHEIFRKHSFPIFTLAELDLLY